MKKYQSFLSENFQFWEVKFSIYLNRHVFVMKIMQLITIKKYICKSGKNLFWSVINCVEVPDKIRRVQFVEI